MAFTRNPSDTSVSPATYTADGPSELQLTAQPKDIAIDGSQETDTISVNASGIETMSLTNYNVRGLEGNDIITFAANTISNSVINGNIGADVMTLTTGNFTNSYFLGGKGDDTVKSFGVNGGEVNGEVNGNIGNDTLDIKGGGVDMYIGGGKNNDIIDVAGDFVRSIIDGNKDNDSINITGGTYTDSSVNGGDGDDAITAAVGGRVGGSTGLVMNGDLGNDLLLSEFNLNTTMTGGEGKDTIDSISNANATSVINGGVDADSIILREGSKGFSLETIIFKQGDSVAATEFADTTQGAITSSGQSILGFDNGVDTITGFTSGFDKFDINFAPPTGITDGTTLPTSTVLQVGTITAFRGTWDADKKNFTIGGAGGGLPVILGPTASDYLYVVGGENESISQTFTSSSNMFVSIGSQLSIGDFM